MRGMSSEQDPVAWLRAQVEARLTLAREYVGSATAGTVVLYLLASGYKYWPGYREEDWKP
jgi:hypothetical protein